MTWKKSSTEQNMFDYYFSYVKRLMTTLRDKSPSAKHTIYSKKRENKNIYIYIYLII